MPPPGLVSAAGNASIRKPVVVHLFKLDFARRPVHIVLVRRVTRPVTRGRVDLADQQAIGRKRRRHDVDDLARCVTAAADFESTGLGSDDAWRQAHPGGSAAVGELRQSPQRPPEPWFGAASRSRGDRRRRHSRAVRAWPSRSFRRGGTRSCKCPSAGRGNTPALSRGAPRLGGAS